MELNPRPQLDPLKPKTNGMPTSDHSQKGINIQSIIGREENSLKPEQQGIARKFDLQYPEQPKDGLQLPANPAKHEPTADPNSLMYMTMPRVTASQTPPQNSETSGNPPSGNLPGIDGIGPPTGNLTSDLSEIQQPRKFRASILIIVGAAVLLLIAGFVYARFIRKPVQQTEVKFTGQDNFEAGKKKGGSSSSDSGQEIPEAWRSKYFGSALCTDVDLCGDKADPDHDGINNIEEYKAGTDPNNPDSDGDGIADGDEVHVFNIDPLSMRTAGIPKYTDNGDLKYKYNAHTHANFTDQELKDIAAKIKTLGLHSPTTKTLTADALSFYMNYGVPPPADAPKSGALDRDTQRSDAIKQISFALIKYKETNQSFPPGSDFSKMVTAVMPALTGRAINTSDPINKPPHVYGYKQINDGQDFQLSYFSETQSQVIVINSADAKKNYIQDQANQRDARRKNDLQTISTALQLYSNDNVSVSNPAQKVFPPQSNWKQVLAPRYMSAIPVDPQTNANYSYTVSSDNQSFVIQALLENPPTGKKGYLCTQESCAFY